MSDPLTDLLTRELAERAEDVTPSPALASLVLRRAHVVRRRRSIAVSAIAAVAAAAVVLAVSDPGHILGTRPTPPAVHTPAPIAPKIVAPQAGPIRVPYVINGTTGVSGSGGRASVHLDGRTIQLPKGWNVLAATRAGDGALVHAILGPVPGPQVQSVVAYVSPTGTVTPEPALAGGAFPAVAGGALMVGRAQTLSTTAPSAINYVQLASGAVTHAADLPADFSIIGPVGARSLLVRQSSIGLYQLWNASTGALTNPEAIKTGITAATGDDWSVVGTDLSGRMMALGEGAMRVISVNPTGTSWTSPVINNKNVNAAPRFSPDGSRIALVAGGRLIILSATDGSVLSRSAPFSVSTQISSLTWEDDADILAQTDSSVATHSHVFRCSASGAECLALPTPSGHLLLAGL
jgi:hypothetical protein